MDPADTKRSSVIPKNPIIFLPSNKITARTIAEKIVISKASFLFCATVNTAVNARKIGRLKNGFIVAKTEPNAFVSSVSSIASTDHVYRYQLFKTVFFESCFHQVDYRKVSEY